MQTVKTVTVLVKSVYGNTLFYPVCDNAKHFARLVGAKTLTPRTLQIAADLGFTVIQKHEEVQIGA